MVTYSKITVDDLDEVTRMYEKYLNSGDLMKEHIKEGIESQDFVGYKAMDEGKMIGMMTGCNEVVLSYPHPELEEKIAEKFKGIQLYASDALAVEPEYRETEVCHVLSRKVLEDIYAKGYRYGFIEMWTYPDGGVPAYHVFKRWGEVIYEEDIPGFYKDLDKYGMICPVCGKKCKCGAKICVVKLNSTITEEE